MKHLPVTQKEIEKYARHFMSGEMPAMERLAELVQHNVNIFHGNTFITRKRKNEHI